jgi:hypothetical protein
MYLQAEREYEEYILMKEIFKLENVKKGEPYARVGEKLPRIIKSVQSNYRSLRRVN